MVIFINLQPDFSQTPRQPSDQLRLNPFCWYLIAGFSDPDRWRGPLTEYIVMGRKPCSESITNADLEEFVGDRSLCDHSSLFASSFWASLYPVLWFPRRGPYPRLHALLACPSLLLCMGPARALAQRQTTALGNDNSSRPEAPLPQSGPQSLANQSSADQSASVSGTVLDASGPAIPGAQVSLTQGFCALHLCRVQACTEAVLRNSEHLTIGCVCNHRSYGPSH